MKRRVFAALAGLEGLLAACGGSSSSDAPPATDAAREPAVPRAPAPSPLRVRYGQAPSQRGDLSLPAREGPHPVVIVIHGGFWQATYGAELMEPICAALIELGFATWNLEYRRVGEAGGGWPGTMLDVGVAIDRLAALAKEHPLDLGRVTALGHSAGGHLALWAAARHRLAKGDPLGVTSPLPLHRVVALAAVADLRRAASEGLGLDAVQSLLGGSPEAVPERYASASPIELLPLGVPSVMVHGGDDGIVPPAHSRSFAAAAKEKGDAAELVEIAGADHFDPIDPTSPAWLDVRRAVRGT